MRLTRAAPLAADKIIEAGFQAVRAWLNWQLRLPANIFLAVRDMLSDKSTKLAAAFGALSALHEAVVRLHGTAGRASMVAEARELVPILWATVERCVSSGSGATLIHRDAALAAAVYARLTGDSAKLPARFWTLVLDPVHRLLMTDRSAVAAEPADLEASYALCRWLLEHAMGRVTADAVASAYVSNAMALLLVHGRGAFGRRARANWDAWLAQGGGAEHAELLLGALWRVVASELATMPKLLAAQWFTPTSLGAAVACVCRTRSDALAADAARVARSALLPAHHPTVSAACSASWLWGDRICARRLRVPVSTLLSDVDYAASLTSDLLRAALPIASDGDAAADGAPAQQRALAACAAATALLRWHPGTVGPTLIAATLAALRVSECLAVTDTDMGIYYTAEGRPFDASIFRDAMRFSSDRRPNRKRESRLYSLEEEEWEQQMRRELARKRGQAIDGPQLSKKQQEQLAEQLRAESATRARVALLRRRVQCAVQLLHACLASQSPVLAAEHFGPICECLLTLLTTPVAGLWAAGLWLDLRTVLPTRFARLAELVAHATLRSYRVPGGDPEPGWCAEPVVDQVARALMQLATAATASRLPASLLHYALPLLEQIALRGTDDGTGVLRPAPALIANALTVLERHVDLARMRAFPLRRVLAMLLHVIVQHPRFEQAASGLVVRFAEHGGAQLELPDALVIVDGLRSSCMALREACMASVALVPSILRARQIDSDDATMASVRATLWLTHFDVASEGVRAAAGALWPLSDPIAIPVSFLAPIRRWCADPEDFLQQTSAAALSAALASAAGWPVSGVDGGGVVPVARPTAVPEPVHTAAGRIADDLLAAYGEMQRALQPKYDAFGRVLPSSADAVQATSTPSRRGIADALAKCAAFFDVTSAGKIMDALLQTALGDPDADVRAHMLNLGVAVVNVHGSNGVQALLPQLERVLQAAPGSDPMHDHIREAAVVLVGTVAGHLDAADPRVRPVVDRLLATLRTPSQLVQEAVARCLPSLVPAVSAELPQLLPRLLSQLFRSGPYGHRRGAAYGLAGFVKGIGIKALKEYNIVTALEEAVSSAKDSRSREGALIGIEVLNAMLGRQFEAYVVKLMPMLLPCFGDTNKDVRMAARDAARVIMANLTPHGVRLVLPSLLEGLESSSWRTKEGSAEMLGTMAHCASRPLAACLPTIVPRLVAVLADSQADVQKAGDTALRQIASVIRSPEISSIVGLLLDALREPHVHTGRALQRLLTLDFAHYIDAASLALIMPVLLRGLRERSTEIRKTAAQIVGHLCSLTDPKDLQPHLTQLLPDLQQVLQDPIPEVRGVAAKALGAIVAVVGEEAAADLIQWLHSMLRSLVSSMDRLGAAQGIAEVLLALGPDRLAREMPGIVAGMANREAHIREAHIALFIYLPAVFGPALLPHLRPVLPCILKGLIDDHELVRDAALRAGTMIINHYADASVELLLPELERGLMDEHWRIRESSVSLLGALLFRVAGVAGKMSTESANDDESFGTESAMQALMHALGPERRAAVLAGVFIARCDAMLPVRQRAAHVWKLLITNTARTLRDIFPHLMERILTGLAGGDGSSNSWRSSVARALGDVIHKLGDRVLVQVLPLIEDGLRSPDGGRRLGVCLGLSEIVSCVSRDHVAAFAEKFLPALRRALCDPLPAVRTAAARSFDCVYAAVGRGIVESVVPPLLSVLADASGAAGTTGDQTADVAEYALLGLQEIMALRAGAVMPLLVQHLTQAPVTLFRARALSRLVCVSGSAADAHLSAILAALMRILGDACAGRLAGGDAAEALAAGRAFVLAVKPSGLPQLLGDLLRSLADITSADSRLAAAVLLRELLGEPQSRSALQSMLPALLDALVVRLTDAQESVVRESWAAVSALLSGAAPEQQEALAVPLQHAIRTAVAALPAGETIIRGFCLPKGIGPFVPTLQQALLHGPPDARERAAQGLLHLVRHTSDEALKPFAISLTGPLIRVVGERVFWKVRAIVLQTLGLLLEKIGAQLRPFLPQLQTGFIRAISDAERLVRDTAHAALNQLVVQPGVRLDPLVAELLGVLRAQGDATGPLESALRALRSVLLRAGPGVSPKMQEQVASLLRDCTGSPSEAVRDAAASCVGALCLAAPTDAAVLDVLEQHVSAATAADASAGWERRQSAAHALAAALHDAPTRLLATGYTTRTAARIVQQLLGDEHPHVRVAGARALVWLVAATAGSHGAPPPPPSLATSLLPALVALLQSDDVAGKCDVLIAVKRASKLLRAAHGRRPDAAAAADALRNTFVPILMASVVHDSNAAVRTNLKQCLGHLLGVRAGTDELKAYAATLDASAAKTLVDFYRVGFASEASRESDAEDDERAAVIR